MGQSIEIAEEGLVFRPDTRLVRMRMGGALDLDADRERELTMLSVAFGRPMPADLIGHFEAASRHWQRGDKALANVRLVFSGLPQLDQNEFRRLQLSEYLLDHGVAPRELMDELGLDASCLAKYDPDQPRVPAGSGRGSGEWTSDSDRWAYVPPVARSFLADATPEIVKTLARFAARFTAPTVILGALFIPTPSNGGVTTGVLPGAPDISFEKDDPAGILRLTTKAADGSDVVVVAQNQRGLYVDLQTGQAIGRDLGGQLYLDLDAVNDTIQDTPRRPHGPSPTSGRRQRQTSQSSVRPRRQTRNITRASKPWITKRMCTRASIRWHLFHGDTPLGFQTP